MIFASLLPRSLHALLKAPPNTSPEAALAHLRAGNQRFVTGNARYPHADETRRALAASADQGDHAYATVLSCSDSRVPVELLFDAGIMDLFVIRVAGNVFNTDEIGCAEYGLAHVNTPLLVILGHSQCGAVTTVTKSLLEGPPALEENIRPLIAPIETAVQRAQAAHPDADLPTLIHHAIEENIWCAMETLFQKSPTARRYVREGRAKVLGAFYALETGEVTWLPETQSLAILDRVEAEGELSPPCS